MKSKNIKWLNQIANFISRYLSVNGESNLGDLARALQQNFLINIEDAEKIVHLVGKELLMSKLSLAALELNLTFNCNLNCDYCFIHNKSTGDRMDFVTAKNAIDLLMDRAVYPNVMITLFGGEPLLEFDLIKQIVPYATESAAKRKLQLTWALTTNGTLINKDMLEFFAQNNINILISMDGGPQTHDRYRRTKSGEGTWHKIAQLVPLVKSYQKWLGARVTVSKEAIDTMREDFNKLVEVGFNQFIIAPAQGSNPWNKEQIEQFGLNLLDILHDYHQYQEQGTPIFIEQFEKNDLEPSRWGCRAGNTSLAIAPNGDISPCSKLLGLTDDAGRCIVGNVNTNIDIYKLQPFREPITRQPQHCKSCSRTCSGGCYAVNYEQTGDHFTPSEENCLFWVVCEEIKGLSKFIKRVGG